MESGTTFEVEELEDRLKQLKRIRSVQNLYFEEASIIEKQQM